LEEFKGVLKISLVAKWIPREQKHYDKKYQSTKMFARLLFPDIFEKDVGVALKSLRKMISPLNKGIKTTEILMCENRFSEIQFNLVPGRCLIKYKKAFLNLNRSKKNPKPRHPDDPDRVKCKENLENYIKVVKTGKKKLNVTTLFIHQIVEKLAEKVKNGITGDEISLLEACWTSYLDQYRKKMSEDGITLDKGVILCDISGSMKGTPMMVSVAVAIFVSELLNEPYRHRFITFDTNPNWFVIPQHASLLEKVEMVMKSPWGGSTDFEKAMDLVLNIAEEHKLRSDQLPKWFLILSDMQFDKANSSKTWDTMYETITKKFKDVGLRTVGEPYEMPHFIFWNLRGDTTGFVTTSSQKNVQLVSGFSVDLLKQVFSVGNTSLESVTPWLSLQAALKNLRYIPVIDTCFKTQEKPFFSHPPPIEELIEINDMEKNNEEEVSGG